MAVIAIPNNEPIDLPRWAYRTLMGRLVDIADEDEKDGLREYIALDGLHFDRLYPHEAGRVAERLARVADQLRRELLDTASGGDRDVEFAETLARIELQLHDVYGQSVAWPGTATSAERPVTPEPPAGDGTEQQERRGRPPPRR